MSLSYEIGALLPRMNGQTTSRVDFLYRRLNDLHQLYGLRTKMKIVFLVDKESVGRDVLKKAGYSKDDLEYIIITSSLSFDRAIVGVELFDIIDDRSLYKMANFVPSREE